MNVINEQIRHSAFGDGKITDQEGNHISVQFSEQYGTKKFLYPEAFQDHLKLLNSAAEKHILKELHDKEVRIKAEALQKRQDHEDAVKALEVEKAAAAALKKKSPAKPKAPAKSKTTRITKPVKDAEAAAEGAEAEK